MKRQNFTSDELTSLGETLKENRPTLSALELDQVKQRARAQATRKTTDIYGWKGIRIMRPRLVATSMLVLGMFFTGSGATLAVISDSQSAGVVQYPETTVPTTTDTTTTTAPEQTAAPGSDTGSTPPPAGQEVLGENFSGGTNEPSDDAGPADGNVVLGETAEGGSAPAAVQAQRQLGTSGGGDELPFTGFAAIPVLLIGILMLATGIALRRSMRSNEA